MNIERKILEAIVSAADNCRFAPPTKPELEKLNSVIQEARILLQTPRIPGIETWTDETGAVWERPTAWAYAKACKELIQVRKEIGELKAVPPIRTEAHLKQWNVSTTESDGFVWLHLNTPEHQQATIRVMARRGDKTFTLAAQVIRYFAEEFNLHFKGVLSPVYGMVWEDNKKESLSPQHKPFTDLSTATPRTKALRFLEQLAQATEKYFYDDGFPRKDVIAKDARATQELIEFQAEKPRANVRQLAIEIEREMVAGHARLKKVMKDWYNKEQNK